MKDAKGHGSNSRGGIGAAAKARARESFRSGSYAGVTATMAAAHQAGVKQAVPTSAQFEKYRADRRETVHRIVSAIQSGTIPKSPWAIGVIASARSSHTASVGRQRGIK